MYRLLDADYSLRDVERFVELSIRRGIGFASLAKGPEGERDVRTAAAAALLDAGDLPMPRDVLEKRLTAFLAGPGNWLAESAASLEAKLFALGLLESSADAAGDAHGAVRSLLSPRPDVTTARLIDELEAAREVLASRRAARIQALQEKNRTVNSGAPEVDPALDERFMRLALGAAAAAAEAGEVPVGAVLVEGDEILAVTGNRTLRDCDPSAHAEMLALRAGAKKRGNHRLCGTTLYVTLEPCPMCSGAIAEARCRRIVFGALDPRRGAVQGALRLYDIPGVNHRPFVTAGVLENEAAALLKRFFEEKRNARGAAAECGACGE